MRAITTALRRWAAPLIAVAALVWGPTAAPAEEFPSHTIRFIVGFAVGGINDIVARVFAQKMSESLGVPIVVDNMAGANGVRAMRYTAQAAPDGYTMALAGATVMAINPHTMASLGYAPDKDFVGAGTITKGSIVIAVNPSVPAHTLKELIEVARNGSLTMASSGAGGIAHLTIEMFNTAGGVKATHVPFTGGAPAASDVVAGHVQSLAMDLAPLQSFIASGQMRAIALVGRQRSPLLPNVPTAIEQGYADMSADNWYAIVLPAHTPAAIVEKLHQAAFATANAADVKEILAKVGSETFPMANLADYEPFLKHEIEHWGAVVKGAGLVKK